MKTITQKTIFNYIKNNIDKNVEKIIEWTVLKQYTRIIYKTSLLNEGLKKVEIDNNKLLK